MTTELPLRPGSTGDAVRDVQRRLAALGFDLLADGPGVYGVVTEAAISTFQARRGLRQDGICGAQTWASLVEAGYRLGDRLLYLHQPMLRGDDVALLQRDLGALGFDAGRVDGIFGPNTVAALVQFQRNAGVTTDGICGPDTLAALRRVVRADAGTTIANVRELERRRSWSGIAGHRFAVGDVGGLARPADALGTALQDAGAVAAVLHHADESVQAQAANELEADAFLGLGVAAGGTARLAYYATAGYESAGGRRLAELVRAELASATGAPVPDPIGMRLPILRETRMPAVLCELTVRDQDVGAVVTAVVRALDAWAAEPLDEG